MTKAELRERAVGDFDEVDVYGGGPEPERFFDRALINGFGNGFPSGIRMLPSVMFPIVYLIVRGLAQQLTLQGTSVGHGVPPMT